MSTLSFKTNIQLKSIIGKDLINDDNIAILELVKNSFDAGSDKVLVTFCNLKDNDDLNVSAFSEKTSRIIIQDFGVGMNLDDIENKWLNIAYSEKKSKQKQYNRLMAGAKGVGRFSCDRLGEYLNLYAKTKDSDKYILLKINWKLFEEENQNKEIQSVSLEYEIISEEEIRLHGFHPFADGGLCLEIIKLRVSWISPIKDRNNNRINWNTEKLSSLKKYLEKLINPHQAFEANGEFGIYLNAPELIKENEELKTQDKFIGKIENTIFDKLDFRTTSVECYTVDNGETIYTELKDRGNTIFWIKEKNPYYPFVKNAKLTVYYLSPYSKAFFTKQTGIQSVNYGSIFLFINGFRVPPYGDVDDDWLNLNLRKTQGTNRFIGLREIVGRVEILDINNDFQIVSSREGLKKNDNYQKLTASKGNDSFIFKAFRRLERYVVEGISWDSIPQEAMDSYDQIAKKIISGETTEDQLTYRENEIVKSKRVYEYIHNIISARPENVHELYINENLILDKIDEEKEQSEKEFEQLISDFENKKIDTDTLSRILEKKALENEDLGRQLREFTKYEMTPATAKAILELQQYKNTIEEQARIIEELKTRLDEQNKEIEQSRSEKLKFEKTVKAEQDKRVKAEQERDFAVSKNKYLLARQNFSSEEVAFEHLINNYSQTADTALTNISYIAKETKLPIELLEQIDILRVYVRKINKLTALLNKADIKTLSENTEINLSQYTVEYFEDFANTTKKIAVSFLNGSLVFMRNTNMLDLSIIFDNLISNSLKAGASQMQIIFGNDANRFFIDISDDGSGVTEPLLSYPDEMFQPGITTRKDGSGIGLNSVRELMRNDLFGDVIFLGNNINLHGATFRLIF